MEFVWNRLLATTAASQSRSAPTKKVHIERFDRAPISGFVHPDTYQTPEGVEVLSLNGTASVLSYQEIRAVLFIREFLPDHPGLERRTFQSRPKIDGLWVQLEFRDGQTLEAVAPNNLLPWEPYGFTVIPPDFSYRNQKAFIPRAALAAMQVLGVVNSPRRRPAVRKKSDGREQIELFD